jgi:aldose 1-epimerase
MLELERDRVRLSLLPENGAAIVGLWLEGKPILHPARPGVEGDPTLSACFAMFPWCNRLSAGAISTADGPFAVPVNWPTTAFPVHGHGWLKPWNTVFFAPDRVAIQYCMTDPHGYSYQADLQISLQARGAKFELSVRNDANRPLPFGIGLHPYFPRGTATGLQLPAERFTGFDALGLPLHVEAIKEEADFRTSRVLEVSGHSALYLDAGEARVSGNDLPVTLRAGGAFRHLQLWAPEGRDFFCIEPLSHRVDDFSRRATAEPHDLPPGAKISGWMSLRVAD